MSEIRDCHYCEHACCESPTSWVDCYVEDGGYFSKSIKDSKEVCELFEFCDIFPKY